MLKVRPEQSDAFQLQAEADFVERIAAYLVADYSDLVIQLPEGPLSVEQIPADQLSQMIENGIARARVYGLSFESSLSAFVTLMFVVAPNFDENPSIHQVLTDEKTETNSRLDNLWGRTSEENWATAKQMYDANAWKIEMQEK
jgi:hypothetical protein